MSCLSAIRVSGLTVDSEDLNILVVCDVEDLDYLAGSHVTH
jgi:hypothetical protein